MVQPFWALKGEYAALVNNYLDNIPIANCGEKSFHVVQEALRSLIEPERCHHVPAFLKDRITSIQELLDQPELYVQDRKDDAEFKRLVLARVASKIQELSELSGKEEEGWRYVVEQSQRKRKAREDHERMARAKAPEEGSKAHVDSFDSWLRGEQERFQQEQTYFPLQEMSLHEALINIPRSNLEAQSSLLSENLPPDGATSRALEILRSLDALLQSSFASTERLLSLLSMSGVIDSSESSISRTIEIGNE